MSVEDYSLNAVTEKTIIMYIFIFLEMAKELGQHPVSISFRPQVTKSQLVHLQLVLSFTDNTK